MDDSYIERNKAAREQLKALIGGLTDLDLRQSVGHDWTVAAALAHLAFWDQKVLGRLEDWERGVAYQPTGDFSAINDSMLEEWLAMDPREAVRQAVATAEVLDQKIASLPPELADAIIAAGLLRLVDRSLHRQEHLGEIEHVIAQQ